MSDHQRKTIRDKVGDVLTTAVPLVSSKVFVNRPNPLWTPPPKCQCVYFGSEEAREENVSEYIYIREIPIIIEAVVQVSGANAETVDDELDEIALQVEQAIKNSSNLSREVMGIVLRRTEPAQTVVGKNIYGNLALEFVATYSF